MGLEGLLVAAGGRSPRRSSISRSAETTSPACNSRTASSARLLVAAQPDACDHQSAHVERAENSDRPCSPASRSARARLPPPAAPRRAGAEIGGHAGDRRRFVAALSSGGAHRVPRRAASPGPGRHPENGEPDGDRTATHSRGLAHRPAHGAEPDADQSRAQDGVRRALARSASRARRRARLISPRDRRAMAATHSQPHRRAASARSRRRHSAAALPRSECAPNCSRSPPRSSTRTTQTPIA